MLGYVAHHHPDHFLVLFQAYWANSKRLQADLARVLVPRGAAPEHVAAIERLGFHSGPMSAHYSKIAEDMTPLLDSDDPNVVTVARVGIDMYANLAEAARHNEHRARIRGLE